MKKKFKIVILPVEKASSIFSYKERPDILFFEPGREYTTIVNHLNILIISDEEIKKGDFCYSERDGWVRQCENPMPELEKAVGAKKIVATTDRAIIINGEQPVDNWYSKKAWENHDKLPQLPESLIQVYIKAYNEGKPITEVELEMGSHPPGTVAVGIGGLSKKKEREMMKPFIKTNSNNEVIVAKN